MRELRRWLFFVRPYRVQAFWSLALLTVMIVLELAIPRLIQRLIDRGIAHHDAPLMLRTSLAMLGISVLSTFVAIGNNIFSVRAGEGVARDLREALFLKIQAYSFGNLDRQRTGRLLVRLTSDVNAVKSLTQASLRIGTRAPLLMLGSLGLMIATSSSLALRVFPLLLLAGVVSVWFVTRMEPLFRQVQERTDGVNNVLQENIAGVRLVKAFVRGEHECARFDVANEAQMQASVRTLSLMATMAPVLALCVNLGVVAVIWSGGLLSIRGDLSLGQLVAFTNYLFTTLGPLLLLSMLINMWAAGFASLKRLQEVLESIPDVQDAPDARSLPADAPAEVVFEGVTFRYPGERCEPVLCDVSFSAAQGETIAILGATGAGKTSLVSLIARFYDADSGKVRVCGRDVRAWTQDSLLSHVGFVPQESVLFSGSVRDNIRYGRPAASEEEVLAAARAAQAHDFILQLPQAYDTLIEQRGVNLSGGQRQRIAIARALLLSPQILILDDATSAVDVETETRLQAALQADAHRRITFVVAQRISTVLNASRILVLEHGRIAAQGSHRELLERSDVYREIYQSQLGAAEELGLGLQEAGV